MAWILASAILVLAAAGPAGAAPAPAAERLAERVIVVANQNDPDSLAIARHYAEVRGVPAANLLPFDLPPAETISWADFVLQLWQPLQDELVRRRWIDAIPLASVDAVGRRRYAVAGHRIAALVICRGVPLRIADDPALRQANTTQRPEFQTNAGAVDSELSLLAADGGYPIDGFVRNPLFGKLRPSEFDRAKVVKVSRLDGPTLADALALVDQAQVAERTGLVGRAYIDLAGQLPVGNRWLGEVGRQVAALGFDLQENRGPATMAAGARGDAAVLYFGWYASDVVGPFALPGYRFPPGAIAMHIHSYSGRTLRSASEGWAGPLVARGATATVGNVSEPYLEFTHRPDLLFRALARGDNLVDAAYFALPMLSWQCVLIGDPLYRPFRVPLADELTHLDSLAPDLAGYAVLRQAYLLEAEGKKAAALALLQKELARQPNFAVALALAERWQAAGRPADAARVLESDKGSGEFGPNQWGLAHAAAEFLRSLGRAEGAVAIYRRLFTAETIPSALRESWLGDARQAALQANNPDQAEAWRQAQDEMVSARLRATAR